MDADRVRGISSQDQEIAEIQQTWNKTPIDMQAEFIDWIADDDADTSREFVLACPDQWIWFIQKCCLVGLRQSVLQETDDAHDA
jgi:hypothetical protein